MLTRTPEAQVFGAHLRELRTARGLTQRELADRCRSNVPFISNMERGLTAPSLAMLLRLAHGLECRVAKLVEIFDHSDIEPGTRKLR